MRPIHLAFALAIISAIPEASAEPNKDQYELQEHCGKRAEEVFKSDYQGGGVANTEDGQSITTYENHYSAIFNKCFFLETVTSIRTRNDKDISTMMTLFDLNEHKDYGTFWMGSRLFENGYGTFVGTEYSAPFPCKWNEQHKACHSESQWREWLKPYMEE